MSAKLILAFQGKIAYASESSWIKRATIQENILLHNQMDKHLYLDVLSACELDTDLSCMPMRDDTLIIDNGANLSGGQRQRISLARAAYSSSDIYVMDQPLTAQDGNTAHKIYKKLLITKKLLLQ